MRAPEDPRISAVHGGEYVKYPSVIRRLIGVPFQERVISGKEFM